MKATKFGKLLRKHRIDKDVNLKQMADSLGVSSSHISSIELGKKNVPESFIDQIADAFSLKQTQITELIGAAAESVVSVKIDMKKDSNNERELVHAFARSYKNLDPEKQKKLKELLQ
jgi:transcriptional regulator with XRE-family HTH domain